MPTTTTQPFNITVPKQTPESVPRVCDKAMNAWLTTQVLPAYDALKANPSRALTAENIRTRLATEHTKA